MGTEKQNGVLERRPSQDSGQGGLGCGTPLQCLRQNLLLILLFCAMCIGIGMGLGLRSIEGFGTDARKLMYLEFPGRLLMNMLKMMIIPLIVSSLIAGVSNLPSQSAGRMGLRAILYYMITTFMAVLLGILLVTTIRPGSRGSTITVGKERSTFIEPVDALLDLIRNALPANIIAACFQQTRTVYGTMVVPVWDMVNGSTISPVIAENKTVPDPSKPSIMTSAGSNVLGLVVFSVAFGIVIGRMGEQGRILRNFFASFSQAIITLVIVIIWYSPIGIIFLLATRIVKMEDPALEFQQLGYYIATVLVGLLIHGFIILPIIYFAFVRKNPFKHLFNMGQALLTALGTASSSATLPVTLRCLELRAKVNPIIGHFVLPIGATINMDGTALYEAVASIYIAQYEGIPLNAGQIVIVSITATAAAIGAAGVPEAGLVTMVIVLTAVGLPIESVGLIYAVDWFLDRFRTMVNVWGDAVGAGVVEALSKKDLEKMAHNDELLVIKDDDDFILNGDVNPAFSDTHDTDGDSITRM